MKAFLTDLLDLGLRYILAFVLLLGGLGLVLGLQALGASEAVAGVVAIVFMVSGAVAVVVFSRRDAARRAARPDTQR